MNPSCVLLMSDFDVALLAETSDYVIVIQVGLLKGGSVSTHYACEFSITQNNTISRHSNSTLFLIWNCLVSMSSPYP